MRFELIVIGLVVLVAAPIAQSAAFVSYQEIDTKAVGEEMRQLESWNTTAIRQTRSYQALKKEADDAKLRDFVLQDDDLSLAWVALRVAQDRFADKALGLKIEKMLTTRAHLLWRDSLDLWFTGNNSANRAIFVASQPTDETKSGNINGLIFELPLNLILDAHNEHSSRMHEAIKTEVIFRIFLEARRSTDKPSISQEMRDELASYASKKGRQRLVYLFESDPNSSGYEDVFWTALREWKGDVFDKQEMKELIQMRVSIVSKAKLSDKTYPDEIVAIIDDVLETTKQ